MKKQLFENKGFRKKIEIIVDAGIWTSLFGASGGTHFDNRGNGQIFG